MSNYATALADRAAVIMGPALAGMFDRAVMNGTGVDQNWIDNLSEIALKLADGLQSRAEDHVSSK
ncbi:hypothetical protein AB4076_00200 [Dyella sp. 2RAF44]|uniref:hypothetical protein n=1 Tax=Dyella sp. 2RAF44 TaxID=3233000 RepID=UPI003F9035C2